MDIRVTKLPKSLVEIEGEIPTSLFESYRPKVTEDLVKDLELPGFRKGHVPTDIALKEIPEMKILEKMANFALNEAYPKILVEQKIDAVGFPEIIITKIAPNNPLGFKIRVAMLPAIILPNCRKIAKETPVAEMPIVTEEELEKTIENLRKMRTGKKDPKPEELPPLDDDFAKSLGHFENLAQFKEKLRENIKLEKEMASRNRRRLQIIEEILKQTGFEVPDVLVEHELNLLVNQFKQNILQAGFKWEDYLKQMKKEEKELRTDWQKDAEKRIKSDLILFRLAEEEGVKPTEEETNENINLLLTQSQNKELTAERVKNYVIETLTKEKTLQLLEGL